jgi:hypothetical protein
MKRLILLGSLSSKKPCREGDLKGCCPHFKILRVASFGDETNQDVEPTIKEKGFCRHTESRHRFNRRSSSPAICNGDL